MPNINSYPTITPTNGDLVLISDVSSSGNPTKTATAGSIAELGEFSFDKTSITSAQIGTLSTIPVTLVGAPGAGKIIVPISIVSNFKYGSATITGNTNLNVMSGSTTVFTQAGGIGFASSKTGLIATLGDLFLDSNTALSLKVATGNPTMNGSTSTLDVYVYYRILTL